MAAKRPKLSETSIDIGANVPTICVLGATGVGKGSTLNSCFSTDRYSTSSMFASDTVKPVSYVLPWKGRGTLIRGVDLCGFSDSEGRDTSFIEEMVAYLKDEVGCVNCFLLLLNSQEARVGMHLKDMLVALKAVFGLPFMNHVMVGFTRWDYTKKGAILRRGVTKEALSRSVNDLLRELIGHSHDCECVFLDNTVNVLSNEELQVVYNSESGAVSTAFDKELDCVRQAVMDNAPFCCGKIEGTMAERDIGRDMIEREQVSVTEGADAFERFVRHWEAPGIEEPGTLEQALRDSAKEARETLLSFLATKTKPDLEHVLKSVLDLFDAQVADKISATLFKNRTAASSSNRDLRMQLVKEYAAFISEISSNSLANRHQCFAAICARYPEVLSDFIARCKGGSLAWQPFIKLQEQLRMEQVGARETMFRQDLLEGIQLPDLSEFVQDAEALTSIIGAKSVPPWLLKRSA